jgi:NADH-quinone oxidoreductase subunit M
LAGFPKTLFNMITTLLILLVLVPLAGAAVAAVIPQAGSAKIWALTVSAITAVLAVGLLVSYPFDSDKTITPPDWATLAPLHASFSLGVDGISLFLVLMTTVVVTAAIAASFDSITEHPRQFYAWMLALLGCMIGVFLARDLLLFYAFFESTLVPSFFLIGVWGGPDRRHAAAKFFLYTFSASVFTLAAIIYIGAQAGSFDMTVVTEWAKTTSMSNAGHYWLALGLFAAFAVKSALFPVHTWLPPAYTEAPTPGTVVLAGVMPKLGTYGILRLVIPMGLVGHSIGRLAPVLISVVGALAVVGILYGGLIAWVQRDMKRLLAYSSFSHLGFILLGLMAMNSIGVQGAVLYMVNHGLSTGALFLCVGMIFNRFKSSDVYDVSGLAKSMPKLSFFIVLFAFSSIGLPGLNGFVSEFLTVTGAFVSQSLGISFGVIAALGVIISAIYMLRLVRHLVMGPAKYPATAGGPAAASAPGRLEYEPKRKLPDLTGREITILVPIAVLVVVLGIAPNRLFLQYTMEPVQRLLTPAPEKNPNPAELASHSPPAPVTVVAAR